MQALQYSDLRLILTYSANINSQRGFSKARVFLLRSLIHMPVTMRWLGFIDSYFKGFGLNRAPWDLVSIPIRSYVSTHMKPSQRVALLKDHYNILAESLSHDSISYLLQYGNIELTSITGKNSGDLYKFIFSDSIRYRREGELTIAMSDKNNINIATLTFTLGRDTDGNKCMLIGGLQGTDKKFGKEKIVEVTRDISGLRPKCAVLECAYAIADFFNVKSIIATSIANHPGKAVRNANNNFVADYDSFWKELSGIENNNKNFQLPRTLIKRTLEEVPSKKKKDWLKRQEFVKQIKSFTVLTLKNMAQVD